MYKKKNKILYMLMIISYLSSFYVYPLSVYALEIDTIEKNQNIEVQEEKKEKEEKTELDLSFSDTIKLELEIEEKETIIKRYLKEKLNIEKDIEINLDAMTYRVKDQEDKRIKQFVYNKNNILELNIEEKEDYSNEIKNEISKIINLEKEKFNVKKIENNQYSINNEKDKKVIIKIANKKKDESNFYTSKNLLEKQDIGLSIKTHIQDIGWQNEVTDGEIAGTIGMNKSLEAIQIAINNNGLTGEIKYQAHVSGIGWQNEVQNNEIAGTTGQGRSIEAIRIKLTEQLEANYDIYYRVNVKSYGWLDWTKNGESAGTLGYGLRMESIQIKLMNKNEAAPGETIRPFIQKPMGVYYETHVQNIGWQNGFEDGQIAGTTGLGKALEGIKIKLTNNYSIGEIKYQAHVSGIGWQNEVTADNLAGTTGQGRSIEAIRMYLTEELEKEYDIYYRVHSQNVGWLDWAKNGENAGTQGFGYNTEAVQIKLVKKAEPAPGATNNPFLLKETGVYYEAHVQDIGWQNGVENGEIAGTTGQGKAIEGIKIQITNGNKVGEIKYQAHVSGIGWQREASSWELAGTTGQGRSIEAIKMYLTEELEKEYDIYYRAHSQNIGWLDWAKNGEPAGTSSIGWNMESIQIKLVKKGEPAPGDTTEPYISEYWVNEGGILKYHQADGTYATGFKIIGNIKYFFNINGELLGTNVRKVIDISSHQKNIDWDMVKNSNEVDAVIVRVSAGSAYEDTMLERNIKELNRLGIPYGIYLYSYAEDAIGTVQDLGTMHEGALEAQRIINAINKYKMHLSFPIYYDLEKWDHNNNNALWQPNHYLPIVRAFGQVMDAAGQKWQIYTNKVWADTALNTPELRDKVDWIAQYNNYGCTYTGSYSGWQYTSSGNIPGIKGNVDINVWFK